jgi:hypothetical protein
MTSLITRPRPWLRKGRVVLLAAGLALLLSACAGAVAQVRMPPKAAAAKAAVAPVPQPQTAQQEVVAAYTGYTSAMTTAFDSRSADQVRQLLGPYLDSATVANALRAFRRAWADDEVTYGQVVQHIIGVRVQGTRAWVHDCDNTSGAGLAYASTGQVVPGSLGSADDNLVTRLNLVDGHWLVWVQTIEELPCTP